MRHDPRTTDPRPGRPAPEEIKKTTQPWHKNKATRREATKPQTKKVAQS